MAKRFYTVQAGDSLSIIARDELGELARWREIAYINTIKEPYTIRPGQVILLPVDTGGLPVTITDYAPPTNGGGVTKQAAFEFSPATLALAGIIAVAVFFWMQEK